MNGKRQENFIPLPGEPDTPEFDRAYWAIRSGQAPEDKLKEKNTWRELVIATVKARASRNWPQKLLEATMR